MFTPAIVKYMKKNLDMTKSRYREQIFASPLALLYIEVPLYESHRIYFCGKAAESEHNEDWGEF